MMSDRNKLMFDFQKTEGLKEDFEKLTSKSNLIDLLKKCTVEAVGTFFLCSTIALVRNLPHLGPLAIGLSLMVMVYSFGYISGAHFNPAVTLAVFIRGRIDYMSALAYVAAQLIGAFIGAALQKEIFFDRYNQISNYPSSHPNVEFITALITEMTFTFALAIVVLNVATTKSQAKNSFFGLAIGMTVTSAAFAAGEISGGAFNPAVGTALPGVHGLTDDLVLYWLGPCLGAALAGFFFRFTVDPDELKELKRN